MSAKVLTADAAKEAKINLIENGRGTQGPAQCVPTAGRRTDLPHQATPGRAQTPRPPGALGGHSPSIHP